MPSVPWLAFLARPCLLPTAAQNSPLRTPRGTGSSSRSQRDSLASSLPPRNLQGLLLGKRERGQASFLPPAGVDGRGRALWCSHAGGLLADCREPGSTSRACPGTPEARQRSKGSSRGHHQVDSLPVRAGSATLQGHRLLENEGKPKSWNVNDSPLLSDPRLTSVPDTQE